MLATLRKFPATFYVANTMEIFERMAWYGFYTVSGLYITGEVAHGGLGLTDIQRGVITGVIPFLLYVFPVVTGSFADKFGYKRTFFLAFSVMTPSYFLLGKVSGFWPFLFVFLLVAIGAALFKPVVTGTVARRTQSPRVSTEGSVRWIMRTQPSRPTTRSRSTKPSTALRAGSPSRG